MHTHLPWNRVLLLEMSRYIGDIDVIWSLASSLFRGHFIRLHADDVKSQWLCHPSVRASLGFALTMWKSDIITHHMPSPVPFRSLQVLILLTTQWLVRALVKLLGGNPVEALQLHCNTQSHWSSWSTVCFPPKGAAVCLLGMHPHLQWNRILLLAMSRYSWISHKPWLSVFCVSVGCTGLSRLVSSRQCWD